MDILILSLFALPMLWLMLTRAIHLFQLESYQFPGYTRALKTHKNRLLSTKTIFPLALYLIAAVVFPWVCFIGAGLFCLLNMPPKMKKPLVFTQRVKRLICLSVILSAALCALGLLGGRLYFSILIYLVILFQPWLLYVWGSICAPVEKAISKRFINGARDMLRSHDRLITIGITGSYGKTSTKYFLHKLLSVKYNVHMTPGNFNTTLGVTRAVREGLSPAHDIFICEMGARHLGDVKEICDLVKPQMGIITSVGPQHLETFGSVENVLSGKLELQRAVEKDGVCFINIDSEPLSAALPQLGGEIIPCGEGGAFEAKNISVSSRGLSFTLTAPDGEEQTFETRLLGKANVQNLTLAIACAYKLGISLKQLAPAVRALQSVPHRLELKPMGSITLIDDAYNSNPEGAKMALDTLAMSEGCRVLITPGLVELGQREEEENTALGAYAASRCDYAIIVGEHNRAAIAAGLEQGGFDKAKISPVKTIEEAFSVLQSLSDSNKFALLLNDLPDNYL